MLFDKKDALKRLFLCPWMDGMTQGAREAMRLCPWMDGMTQGAQDGSAVHVRGWTL